MTTEALKTTQITNMDALPRVPVNARLSGSPLLVAHGWLTTVLTAATTGSTYRMVRLPQNAMIQSVLLTSDDMGTTGDSDVGIYLPRGGAAVDADFFATAQDINAAARNLLDVTHSSGNYAIEDVEKPLWEALGDTIDTSIEGYDVVLTFTEASTAVGDLAITVYYTV